jgi:hypothetical protein
MFQLARVTDFTFRVLSNSGETFCQLEEYKRIKCGKLNSITKEKEKGRKTL